MDKNKIVLNMEFDCWSDHQFNLIVGLLSGIIPPVGKSIQDFHKRNKLSYEILHSWNEEVFEKLVLPLKWEY